MKHHFFPAAFLVLLSATATAQAPNWTVNPFDYQYNMIVIGVAVPDCVESVDSNDVVAAFVGDTVRGVETVNVEFAGRWYAFLFVYSNNFSGETLTFNLYDASADTVLACLDTLIFTENDLVGNVEDPWIFRNKRNVGSLEASSQTVPPGTPPGTVIALLTAYDENQQVVPGAQFAFVNDALGPNNSWFSLNGNQLVWNGSGPAQTSYQIHVQAFSDDLCPQDTVWVLNGSSGVTGNGDPLVVRFFPNPVRDVLLVDSAEPLVWMQVFDAAGRLRSEGSGAYQTWDVSAWDAGLYRIRWRTFDGRSGWSSVVVH